MKKECEITIERKFMSGKQKIKINGYCGDEIVKSLTQKRDLKFEFIFNKNGPYN